MNLKEAILPVTSSNPSRKCVESLFDEFNRMAIAYLRTKERSGRLATHLFGISIEDLGLDCIAELFEQNNQGEFVRLIDYYKRFDLQSINEEELMSESRRLIFSEVTRQLFRRYAEADPNLHKLIRNLKDMKPNARACVQETNGSWHVCFGAEEGTTLPLMPPELLEFHLAPIVSATDNLRAILDNLAEVFADQAIYRRAYPLVGFAQVLLSAFVRLDEGEGNDSDNVHSLGIEDIERLIAESVGCVKSDKHAVYVGKGKMDEQSYSTYFQVITEFLERQYGEDGNVNESLFSRLSKKMNHLDVEQYASQHRVYMEFLLKETRAVFLQRVRKEL